MKKLISLFAVFIVALCAVLPVNAAYGNVIYDGNAREFIFAPGGEYSLTDLFLDFKGVMPGDVLTQKITVKNDAAHNVNIKVYLRALGAYEDSVAFLSQLLLKVQKSDAAGATELFDATADQTDGLSDWVCLGELPSGSEVDLDVTLQVPIELGNDFQGKIGYLDWEFMVEEFPQGGSHHPSTPQDPTPTTLPGMDKAPETGDSSHIELYIILMVSSLLTLIILFLLQKREKNKDSQEKL